MKYKKLILLDYKYKVDSFFFIASDFDAAFGVYMRYILYFITYSQRVTTTNYDFKPTKVGNREAQVRLMVGET